MAKKSVKTSSVKIVIHIDGGRVTTIMSSDPSVEVELFDLDNLKEDPDLLTEDGESPDSEELWKEKTAGMKEVF